VADRLDTEVICVRRREYHRVIEIMRGDHVQANASRWPGDAKGAFTSCIDCVHETAADRLAVPPVEWAIAQVDPLRQAIAPVAPFAAVKAQINGAVIAREIGVKPKTGRHRIFAAVRHGKADRQAGVIELKCLARAVSPRPFARLVTMLNHTSGGAGLNYPPAREPAESVKRMGMIRTGQVRGEVDHTLFPGKIAIFDAIGERDEWEAGNVENRWAACPAHHRFASEVQPKNGSPSLRIHFHQVIPQLKPNGQAIIP
jgi:hypothetical protein